MIFQLGEIFSTRLDAGRLLSLQFPINFGIFMFGDKLTVFSRNLARRFAGGS